MFNLQAAQKRMLIDAITYTKGNLMQAQELLGTSRQTLYRLIDVHGVDLKQIRDRFDQTRRRSQK